MDKLPAHLLRHVITMAPTASLEDMVNVLNNVLYWTDTSHERTKPDPMDLGDLECEARAEYRPVYSGSKIHYQNITGPKTLMIAWKKLISANPEFKKNQKVSSTVLASICKRMRQKTP